MSDVDKLQNAEERLAQHDEALAQKEQEASQAELDAKAISETQTRPKTWDELDLDTIRLLANIRSELTHVQDLALSIKEKGLLTPLIVRRNEKGDHELIAGARRLQALKLLGETKAMCEIIDDLTDAETYALMLTENIQRETLPPVQVARALRMLLDLHEGYTAAKLARSLGVSPTWAQKHFRLLELPEKVQKMLDDGDLSFTVADMLRRGQKAGRISESEAEDLAEKIIKKEATTADVRKVALPTPKPRTIKDGEEVTEEATSSDYVMPDNKPYRMRESFLREKAESYTTTDDPLLDEVDEVIWQLEQSIKVPDKESEKAEEVADSSEPSAPARTAMDSRQAYTFLLGMIWLEWATDDYLENLNIERERALEEARKLNSGEALKAMRQFADWLLHGPKE